MKLSQFTDFGLRSLMYLAQRPGQSVATITEMSEQLDISRNHLVKVVQFLSNQKYYLHREAGEADSNWLQDPKI